MSYHRTATRLRPEAMSDSQRRFCFSDWPCHKRADCRQQGGREHLGADDGDIVRPLAVAAFIGFRDRKPEQAELGDAVDHVLRHVRVAAGHRLGPACQAAGRELAQDGPEQTMTSSRS